MAEVLALQEMEAQPDDEVAVIETPFQICSYLTTNCPIPP